MRGFVALAFSIVALTGSARAQEPRALGVYFDDLGRTNCLYVPQTYLFDLFVVSFEVPGGQQSYGFTVELDDRLVVLEEEIFPAGAANFGAQPGPPENDRNYLVGTGGICLEGTNALVRLRCALMSYADDVQICIGPGIPSSLQPPLPEFLPCRIGVPNEIWWYDPVLCGVLNPTAGDDCASIPVTTGNWGALKAQY